MKAKFLVILLLGLLAGETVSWSAALTLESYLDQVKKGNEGVQALITASEAMPLRKDEARLLTRPNLFANVTFYSDAKPTVAPSFMGTRTLADTYNFGFSQQTPFGLSGKLYYQWTYTRIEGASSPVPLSLPIFYEAKPVLELNQSLLKNGFGSELRSQVQAAES
ncbi:MAG: hypothetical protein EB120_04655, partial [Proteobacteria bacterium]|nr:hypothetical protein [Pseudomonadota bacterium]